MSLDFHTLLSDSPLISVVYDSENCPDVEVHVEVGETFRGSALQGLYSSQPALGSSIGLDVSGTLGGYLELRKNEQSKVVGFTCHHVLLPPPPDRSKPSGKFSASYTVYVKLNNLLASLKRVYFPLPTTL